MRVAIIGGGAAGLMTAATIAETNPDIEIMLIERNPSLGKKVIISGGGRCNVTTGIRDIRALFTKYPRGSKFLSSALYGFPPEAVYEWFEAHGVPLKTEEDQRVFPVSDKGTDVVDAFEKLFKRTKVTIFTDCAVTKVTPGFTIECKNHTPIAAHVVVLTTGGQAYRHTGSVGDGYAFAEQCGHTITNLAPSLSSFICKEQWPRTISGVSFEYAEISAAGQSFTGAFVFTHTGVSGPAVFALSALTAYEPAKPVSPLPVHINLFPDHSEELLHMELKQLSVVHAKKNFKTVLDFLLPKSLVDVVLTHTKIDGTRHAAELSKKELLDVVQWLQHIPLHAIGKGAGDEFVTAGGVELAEVNPSTMESKICPGLYFAGEILNIDGFTGGFNLQASWATGRLAGLSIAQVS